MREGFYNVDYQGVTGIGNAVIVLHDGNIIGAGVGRGRYDGSYDVTEEPAQFRCAVKVSIPEGSPTVMGAVSPSGGMTFDIETTLIDETDVQIVPIVTPYGAVQATVEFIRAL